MTYQELISKGADALASSGVLNAKVDAWELFSYCSSIEKKDYLIILRDEVEDKALIEKYKSLIDLRKTRKPLQQILGFTEFMGLTFEVNQNVLCPRQDTELLVEQAISRMEKIRKIRDIDANLFGDDFSREKWEILDLCTGSGCVLVSLMKYLPYLSGTGVDISAEALEVARANAKRNMVHPNFLKGDLFEPVFGRKFHLITANPPYIPTDVIDKLMPEVRDFEPKNALDGHEDGLYYYKCIVAGAASYLFDGGWLVVEIGVDQKIPVETIFFENGFSDIRCHKDYAGNDRVVAAQMKQGE